MQLYILLLIKGLAKLKININIVLVDNTLELGSFNGDGVEVLAVHDDEALEPDAVDSACVHDRDHVHVRLDYELLVRLVHVVLVVVAFLALKAVEKFTSEMFAILRSIQPYRFARFIRYLYIMAKLFRTPVNCQSWKSP